MFRSFSLLLYFYLFIFYPFISWIGVKGGWGVAGRFTPVALLFRLVSLPLMTNFFLYRDMKINIILGKSRLADLKAFASFHSACLVYFFFFWSS